MKAPLILALLGAAFFPAPAQDTFSPDSEGFIRNWLVLAPIAIEEGSAASEIDKDLLKGETKIKPKAGEKMKFDGKEIAWKAHKTADFFIDFLESFGKERGEDAAAYAVVYVIAEAESKVKLAVGSNDQCKAWVNGKEILKFTETRTLEKDTDKGDVTLAKGQNVLVFKVINEKNNWQGCARFLKEGSPVKDIKISLTPQ
jgi:uncharacterized Zn ribbon protein